MPTRTIPIAPMLVHTKYAVPIGILSKVLLKQLKLNIANIIKAIVGFALVNPSDNFNEVANATSNMPATINSTHGIYFKVFERLYRLYDVSRNFHDALVLQYKG